MLLLLEDLVRSVSPISPAEGRTPHNALVHVGVLESDELVELRLVHEVGLVQIILVSGVLVALRESRCGRGRWP